MSSLRTHLPELEIAARLILAALFAAMLGIDREIKERSAGLRTHMLVAVAAAVFTVITSEIYSRSSGSGDPIRIIEAVTAGVAFLAGGAIIQGREHVSGLTTGAGLWLAGSIGVACGAGLYSVALMGTALAMFIMTVLSFFKQPAQTADRPTDRPK